ncbi:unnamed protein product [Bemisia tabaci]|uniref:BEACH domain-containing protein n=1 Tax=Bemisia tabaci TaxID=7038 RepID=A0A9P0F131_BEMTA|nr:unnamed protein product [Bemisia tabaci]
MVSLQCIQDDLKISASYVKSTSKDNWFEAVLHQDWLKKINESHSLVESPKHETLSADDVKAQLFQGDFFPHPWRRTYIKVIKKEDKMVLPLAKARNIPETKGSSQLTFSQILHYVSVTNYKNLWKEATKKYSGCSLPHSIEENPPVTSIKYNTLLRDAICRLYDCQIVNISSSSSCTSPSKPSSQVHRNILPALAVLESSKNFYIIQDATLVYTVQDSVSLSPALLGNCYYKPLFIIYQLLQAAKWLHDKGLMLGNIQLSEIFISDDLWIQVSPRLEDNIFHIDPGEETDLASNAEILKQKHHCDPMSLKQVDSNLSHACREWVYGNLSNFDYLMLLNRLAGRKFGDPKCHYIFPWVSDFSSRSGNNFRDLTKSKYRLNKGDRQLDLTFDVSVNNTSSKQIPHHISDVLSEITYYIYLSRIMPRNILCQYVRSKWVPAEYPSSIQRLQSWTPDECIPEFFYDPNVFKSIHEDLPDLEIPSWATSFEDFIKWHRSILENNYVSEKLNHWIDLTFGYKLSGNAAVKSKNVCLQLVDNHISLTSSGIMQLFTQPHPQKLTPALFYFNNIPLRIFSAQKNKYGDNSSSDEVYSEDLDDSFDSHTSVKSSSSSLTLSKFLSRSRNSLLTAGSTDSPSPGNSEKCNADIYLPHDYNPAQLLSAIESYVSFMKKSFAYPHETTNVKEAVSAPENLTADGIRSSVTSQRGNEIYALCCVVVEIFAAPKLRVFGITDKISLKERIKICKSVFDSSVESFPFCVQDLIRVVFDKNRMDNQVPFVTKFGVPPPSAHQLLISNLSLSLLPFPSYLVSAYKMFETFQDLFHLVSENENHPLIEDYIRMLTNEFDKAVDNIPYSDNLIYLLLPNILKLFEEPSTCIVAIWYMFDRVSKLLGTKGTQKYLSDSVLQLYNLDNCTESKFLVSKQNKYLKFYHRNFILCLIIRFGFKTFLELLITPLIEAVGCYRDIICNKSGLSERDSIDKAGSLEQRGKKGGICKNSVQAHGDSLESTKVLKGSRNGQDEINLDSNCADIDFGVETFDNQFNAHDSILDDEDGSGKSDNKMKFSETAADTLIWLSSRIGPVLTARYVTRNLLRMLTLSYSDVNHLEMCEPIESEHASYLNSEVVGDKLSENILKCLMFCVTLYGENFIVLQYLPHIIDIISTSRKNKITPNLESGLIGSLVLLKHIVSCIPVEQFSSLFQDTFCDNILYPCILMISSKNVQFPSDSVSRSCLILKFIDAVITISLLVPPKQLHTISPILQTFFKCFSHCNPKNLEASAAEKLPNNCDDVVSILRKIFSPKLAYLVYDHFSKHFSESFMERVILNHSFIKELCDSYRKYAKVTDKINIVRDKHSDGDANLCGSAGSFGKSVVITGNRIDLYESEPNSSPASNSQSNDFSNRQRYLCGNWLAYWEHELNQLNSNFQFNQIKLQQFNSHQSSIKSLCVLDNENSFLSASRDKTVKIWSIHNEGDGNHVSNCQWTYTSHKKSVMSLVFVDKHRVIASTDATVHLWDPFLGISLNQINTNHCVNTLKTISSSTSNILAANTDASVLVLDTRIAQYVSELKVSIGPVGLIRCIAVSPAENWIAVGQTSGYLTVLDLRTGMVLLYWKAHEGEILQLVAYNESTLISSSLDQSVCVWNISDGKLKTNIKGLVEPVHCLALFNSQLISGTTANKIGVHSSVNAGATFSSTKLKAETFKGVLTSLAMLPLNRQLLLGFDNGGITLLC